jgi:hypothetical protein
MFLRLWCKRPILLCGDETDNACIGLSSQGAADNSAMKELEIKVASGQIQLSSGAEKKQIGSSLSYSVFRLPSVKNMRFKTELAIRNLPAGFC